MIMNNDDCEVVPKYRKLFWRNITYFTYYTFGTYNIILWFYYYYFILVCWF